MNLQMTALDGARFTRSTVMRHALVAEASDVGFKRVERIWDDACDVGIAIRGKQHTVRFYLDHTHNVDGDVLWWDFKVVERDGRLSNGIKTVRIFND